MKFTLEKHKFFPYVAWVLVFGFAFFTYTLVSALQKSYADLGESTQNTVDALENGV